MDEFLTIRDAVALCGASERKLRQAIESGKVSFYLRHDQNARVGTGNRQVKHVRKDELMAWIAADSRNLINRELVGRHVKTPA
jgi:hypothetical protein